eukprot:467980-Pleurochrysis_carterae.AAC.1
MIATHTGVPGHYIIDFVHDAEVSIVSLPAVVDFCDGGLADARAISFKLAANQKLYVQCVNLLLMTAKDKETKKDAWVDDKKTALVKLKVVKTFTAVQSRDGCALAESRSTSF